MYSYITFVGLVMSVLDAGNSMSFLHHFVCARHAVTTNYLKWHGALQYSNNGLK